MDLLEYLESLFDKDKAKEIYDKIMADKNNELLVNNKKDPSYVDKKDYDTIVADKDNLEKTVKKHEKDLGDLKKELKDNKELQEKIEALEEENKNAKETYEKEKEDIKYNYELDRAIEKSGARNSKAILGMIDKDKVKLVNDTLVGLEEQIKALKESDSYLFNDVKNDGAGGTGKIGGQRIDTLGNNESGSDKDGSTGNKFVDALLTRKKAEKESSDGLDNFFK